MAPCGYLRATSYADSGHHYILHLVPSPPPALLRNMTEIDQCISALLVGFILSFLYPAGHPSSSLLVRSIHGCWRGISARAGFGSSRWNGTQRIEMGRQWDIWLSRGCILRLRAGVIQITQALSSLKIDASSILCPELRRYRRGGLASLDICGIVARIPGTQSRERDGVQSNVVLSTVGETVISLRQDGRLNKQGVVYPLPGVK